MQRLWRSAIVLACASIIVLLTGWEPGQARLALGAPASQAVDQGALDAYIQTQMRDLKIPGLALAVVRGDQIEYMRGYGTADDAGRAVTPQTPFLVASLSKSITALGVMQLVEAGKIDLDTPVQHYLPWFHTADKQASARITIRHLLNQTSGFSELEGYVRNLERSPAEDALEMSVRALSSARLNAAPGERYEYSNTNYDILGLVIQTVSGIPYETYIEQNIFAPLRMQNSYTSLEKARVGGLSTGYISFFGLSTNYDGMMPYLRTVIPSTGLFSSVEDMAKYLLVHLNDGRGSEGFSLLSPAGIDQLHAPGVAVNDNVHYAMGLITWPFRELAPANGSTETAPTALSHGGAGANFRSMVVMVPDLQIGVVVLINKLDQRREEAYDHIVWNTVLMAAGLAPEMTPGSPGFLARYGQVVGMIVVGLLVASFIWSARLLFRRPGHITSRTVRSFMVLLLLDLAIAGFTLLNEIPPSDTTLPLTLTYHLEVGLMVTAVLVLTLGWGLLRTVLLLVRLPKKEAAVRQFV